MILFSVILLVTFFCLHKDDNDGMEKTRLLPMTRHFMCHDSTASYISRIP